MTKAATGVAISAATKAVLAGNPAESGKKLTDKKGKENNGQNDDNEIVEANN